MTEEIDIWRAANPLVKWHGTDAGLAAARRDDEFLARGDVDGNGFGSASRAGIAAYRTYRL